MGGIYEMQIPKCYQISLVSSVLLLRRACRDLTADAPDVLRNRALVLVGLVLWLAPSVTDAILAWVSQ